MRSLLILAAAGIIVAANAAAWLAAWQNRRAPSSGPVELSAHELPLVRMPSESTVTLLEVHWDVPGRRAGHARHRPAWLDAAKLAELGFDCSLPVDDEHARAHYGSQLPREAFVVLAVDALPPPPEARAHPTRLRAIDAAPDPRKLRERYPDARQYLVVRAVVRLLRIENPGEPEGSGPSPRLEGLVEAPIPGQLFVPRPFSVALVPFRSRDGQAPAGAGVSEEPLYAITVMWGTRYEPWVAAVRAGAGKTEER